MDLSTTAALRLYDQARNAARPMGPAQGDGAARPLFDPQAADGVAAGLGAPLEPTNATAEVAPTFFGAFQRAAIESANTLARGEATAEAAMGGRADAHAVVEALAAAEMALQTAVTVRDRVVEAYQEILRMPV